MEEKLKAFRRLLEIMDELREKCPWDREQTLESLRNLTIEETYELADAILDQDLDEIRKELGDLMLHIVFYSKIGSEKQAFDVADVLNGVCDKLIFRFVNKVYGFQRICFVVARRTKPLNGPRNNAKLRALATLILPATGEPSVKATVFVCPAPISV